MNPGDQGWDTALCGAIGLQLTASRNAVDFQIVSEPDKVERTAPAIELVAQDSLGTMCFEHTLIESFPDQTQTGYRFNEVVPNPIPAPDAPAGLYSLAVPTNTFDGLRSQSDRRDRWDALYGWTVEAAPTIAGAPPGPRRVARSAEGWLLTWTEPPVMNEATLHIGLLAPADLELRREKRLVKALTSKCVKLAASVVDDGSLTVLVLENRDVSMANPWLITHALRAAFAAEATPLPHLVALADNYGGPITVQHLLAAYPYIQLAQRYTLPRF